MNKSYVTNISNSSFSILVPKGCGTFEFDKNIIEIDSTEIINRVNEIGDESKLNYSIKYNFRILVPISTEIEFNYNSIRFIYIVDYQNKTIYKKIKTNDCILS